MTYVTVLPADTLHARSPSPTRDASSASRQRGPSSVVALVLAIVAAACVPRTQAQARDSAHQNVHIEIFGMGTYYHPDYGTTGNAAAGVTGGTTLDWRFGYLRTGVEVRSSYTTYSFMSQQQLGVGPHVVVDVGRFHPYADFLIGYGVANFKQYSGTYRANDSTVRSFGGGLDYAVSRFWAVRVDYQLENWDFDSPRLPFTPQSLSVGGRYMVHFPTRRGPH